MNTINFNVNTGGRIVVRQYEHMINKVAFSGFSAMATNSTIYIKLEGIGRYPLVDMEWEVNQAYTKNFGAYKCQLEEFKGNTLVQESKVFDFYVSKSVRADESVLPVSPQDTSYFHNLETAIDSKVGYAIYTNSHLKLYTKQNGTLIADLVIQGGSGGTGITEDRCKEIIESYGYVTTSTFTAHTHSYNDLTDLPTIPEEYDDTEIRQSITSLNSDLGNKANSSEVVKVTSQTLTDSQKTQVRTNLGIVTLTQEEYDLLEVKDENTLYFTYEGE